MFGDVGVWRLEAEGNESAGAVGDASKAWEDCGL